MAGKVIICDECKPFGNQVLSWHEIKSSGYSETDKDKSIVEVSHAIGGSALLGVQKSYLRNPFYLINRKLYFQGQNMLRFLSIGILDAINMRLIE